MLCGILGEEKEILVEHDDGIRPDISTAALAKLKAVFKKDGTTTAGNSSQVPQLCTMESCVYNKLSSGQPPVAVCMFPLAYYAALAGAISCTQLFLHRWCRVCARSNA